MRSNQIHEAIANGHNRFEICHLMSKGAVVLHKPGDYMKDSINLALGKLCTTDPTPTAKPTL